MLKEEIIINQSDIELTKTKGEDLVPVGRNEESGDFLDVVLRERGGEERFFVGIEWTL